MPAVIERVIAKTEGVPPVTEWLESVSCRTWTARRRRAHEFASHGEADLVAMQLREERDQGEVPFFLFAKISPRHPEPELALPAAGELTFEGREQSEREEAAKIRAAIAEESDAAAKDWHRHAVNCGWD